MISEEQMEKIAKCRSNKRQIVLYTLELSRRIVLAPTIGRNVVYKVFKGMDEINYDEK